MALAAIPAAVGILHVGTLGLVLEPRPPPWRRSSRSSRAALVVVDPNCRPTVISDPTPPSRACAASSATLDLVKVSEEDLAWLEPGRTGDRAARAMLDHGPGRAADPGRRRARSW